VLSASATSEDDVQILQDDMNSGHKFDASEQELSRQTTQSLGPGIG